MNDKDVERNLRRVYAGKPLDLPLRLFSYRMRCKFRAFGKKYMIDKGIKTNAQRSFYNISKGNYGIGMEEKVQWCLWFLFYYNKSQK